LVQQSAQFDCVDSQKYTCQSLDLGDNVDEVNFSGDRNDTQPVIQQSNLNDPLRNSDDGMMTDAVPISE
jgi:hypothetical protein